MKKILNWIKENKNYLIRKSYHVFIGMTLGYIFSLIVGFNLTNFPITWEYWNNIFVPVVGGMVGAGIPAFFWERWQEIKFGAPFSQRDILITAIAGGVGSAIAMKYDNWYVLIPTIIISIILVLKHYKE